MTTERQLSNQPELVHQLDPEPVFDYLLQHRALDQSSVDVIRSEEKLSDRNVKLLQHLEELGNPAIELFINALRQSGQMHLASSLDVEHRIKPVSGKGYWEKQRYKGQVTISFQLLAAKVLVRKDSEEDRSPRIVDINAMLTPFKVKHSYENMAHIDENEKGPKARKILEYSYEEEDEKRSCWCCLPFLCCSSRTKKKKEKQKQLQREASLNISKQNGAELERSNSDSSVNFCDVMVSLPSQPSSPIKSGSTFFKTKKSTPHVESPESQSMSQKSDSLDRNSNHHLSEIIPTSLPSSLENGQTEMEYDAKQEEVSVVSNKAQKGKGKVKKKSDGKKKAKSNDTEMVEMNNHINDQTSDGKSSSKDNKENNDPAILELTEQNEKVNGKTKLKAGDGPKLSPPKTLNTKTSTGMKRSETYELVERWKSEGRAYETARDHFFTYFDNTIQSRIVRYFEQQRSTLVLQVGLQDGMAVSTICMTTRQVKKLREDYEMGVVHEDLVRCVRPQDIVDKMECCAIHLRTVINEDDFVMSFQELS